MINEFLTRPAHICVKAFGIIVRKLYFLQQFARIFTGLTPAQIIPSETKGGLRIDVHENVINPFAVNATARMATLSGNGAAPPLAKCR